MAYTARELRWADLFSLLLIVLGVFLLAVGVIAYSIGDDRAAPAGQPGEKNAVLAVREKSPLPPGTRQAVCGFTLLCLGTALTVKVRRLKRSGGVEPA